jgi:hypothetical protein
MLDLGEYLKRFAADALSGRIRRYQVGKFRFQIDKLFVKPVVCAIADRRRSFFVITSIVLPNLVSELCDSLRRLSLVFGHEA